MDETGLRQYWSEINAELEEIQARRETYGQTKRTEREKQLLKLKSCLERRQAEFS